MSARRTLAVKLRALGAVPPDHLADVDPGPLSDLERLRESLKIGKEEAYELLRTADRMEDK